MTHAITLADVLFWVGIPVGLFVLGGILLGILSLFNPFGSGH